MEVTTEGGLDVAGNLSRAEEVVRAFTYKNIPTSMFIDPDATQLEASAKIGSPWVELHTGSFARAWSRKKNGKRIEYFKRGMEVGISLGLQVNAGHGINYENVESAKSLLKVTEFNIGHSIICRSLEYGLADSVSTMRQIVKFVIEFLKFSLVPMLWA